MNSLLSIDRQFVEIAQDEVRCAAVLTELNSRKSLYRGFGITILVPSTILLALSDSAGGLAGCLFACVLWMLALKYEADIRTLRIIRHLEESDAEARV